MTVLDPAKLSIQTGEHSFRSTTRQILTGLYTLSGGVITWGAPAKNEFKVLSAQHAAVGNVGAGEDTLMSYDMTALELANNGDFLQIEGFFTGNAADFITLKFHLGSTAHTIFGGAAVTAGKVQIVLFRRGATSQWGSRTGMLGTALGGSAFTMTETLANALTIKFTGENTTDTSSNAIVQEAMTIVKGRAA